MIWRDDYTWDPRERRHSIGGVRILAFSPDGSRLAVGGIAKIGNVDHLDGKALLHVFDWAKGERRIAFEHSRHMGLINRLAYTRDGEGLLAAGGAGGGFFFWFGTKNNKPLGDEDAKMHVHGFVADEAFRKVYIAGHGGVAIWEVQTSSLSGRSEKRRWTFHRNRLKPRRPVSNVASLRFPLHRRGPCFEPHHDLRLRHDRPLAILKRRRFDRQRPVAA